MLTEEHFRRLAEARPKLKLAEPIEKRKQDKSRVNVMAAYQASHEKFGPLYKKLAE